jgi:hypothetical protein
VVAPRATGAKTVLPVESKERSKIIAFGAERQ